MNRRTYLTAALGGGAALAAGCLGRAASDTVLDQPDDQPKSEDLPYPAYGQELPEATLPDPLAGRDVSTAEFEGERTVVLTFVFTNCPDGVCPALTQTLRHAQADAAENGYSGEITLLAATFDPERDTAEALREFGDKQNVDYEADNWHFLRPESKERARKVIGETYGVDFERVDTDDLDMDGNHDMEAMGEYTFDHLPLIFLVNEDGYIERAYAQVIQPSQLVEDLTTVVDGNGNGPLGDLTAGIEG